MMLMMSSYASSSCQRTITHSCWRLLPLPSPAIVGTSHSTVASPSAAPLGAIDEKRTAQQRAVVLREEKNPATNKLGPPA